MSNFSTINDDLSVSAQLTEADFETAASEGFKAILNLRPDGEKPGYLSAAEAGIIAARHGLDYHHIPVQLNALSEEIVQTFADTLEKISGPALGHCASGKRVAILWALSHAAKLDVGDIIGRAASAGHDISGLRPHLEARAAA